jgi:membrane associated rhomboid family serine protease
MSKIKLFGSNPLNQILLINILVYIIGVTIFLFSPESYKIFTYVFSIKSSLILNFLTPFSFITHGFLHANHFHLLSNLVMFGLFYPIFSMIEKERIWRIYLTTVLVTGIVFMLYANLYVGNPCILLGMSGGLFALISYCSNRWDNLLVVDWGFFKVRLRHLFYMLIFLSIIGFLNDENAGGEVCHLTAMLVGWYLYKRTEKEDNKKSEV